MNSTTWRRVSKAEPCPICERGDWCLVAGPQGDLNAAICPRTESDRRCGEAGWLHRLRKTNGRWPVRRRITIPTQETGEVQQRPVEDLAGFARQCQLATSPGALRAFAESLDLNLESLRRLGVGWSARHKGWTFPMLDASGKIRGIRLRLTNGRKLAVRGGREGLFSPSDLDTSEELLITEGPTDCAALLDLGFVAIGRPSCTGGVKLLVDLCRSLQPPKVVIVGDNDGPGRRGAESLAMVMAAYSESVHAITPPEGVKDVRAWRTCGATRQDVQQVIDSAPARQLSIHTRKTGRKSRGR